MMKTLFIGGMYSKEYEGFFRKNIKNDGYQSAANAFQWSIIKGLFENDADYEVVSFPSLPCYPNGYNNRFTPEVPIAYNGRNVGISLKYNTTILLKEFSIHFRLKKYLKRWVKKNSGEKLVIMTYSPQAAILSAVHSVKKSFPNVATCNIIADLVDDATNPVFKLSIPKYIQARIEQIVVRKSYDFTDKFVLLSEAMLEKIPQANHRYIVVEGIAGDIDSSSDYQLKSSDVKTILYAGTIQKFAGVFDLVKAFKMTKDENYRLEVCGSGADVLEFKQLIEDDPRIIYHGMIPRDEVLKLQKTATLVVNPRKPSVSLTRYSFPSKTMEYLSSGTPMLGYRLEGIPSDYYPYFYSPEDEENETLAKTIDTIFLKSEEERWQFAESAKDFIIKNKTPFEQAKRILSFLAAEQ